MGLDLQDRWNLAISRDDGDDTPEDPSDPTNPVLPGPSFRKEVATAVAIAALSTLFGHLIEWGVEELKDHLGKKKPLPAPVAPPATCANCERDKPKT